MTARIFMSLAGKSRKWNTDHVAQTRIQESQLYIVCDGIQPDPGCGQLVHAFCREVCSQKQPFGVEVASIEKDLRNRFSKAACDFKNKGYGNYSFCVAAALIHDSRLFTIHAGDCRIGKVPVHRYSRTIKLPISSALLSMPTPCSGR